MLAQRDSGREFIQHSLYASSNCLSKERGSRRLIRPSRTRRSGVTQKAFKELWRAESLLAQARGPCENEIVHCISGKLVFLTSSSPALSSRGLGHRPL